MNESFLKEIYFSNEGQSEKIKPNEEHKRLIKEAGEYYDKLFGILGEEPQKWLDEIWLLNAGIQSEWGFVNFQAGLKFGLQLIAQVFTEPISDQSQNID